LGSKIHEASGHSSTDIQHVSSILELQGSAAVDARQSDAARRSFDAPLTVP